MTTMMMIMTDCYGDDNVITQPVVHHDHLTMALQLRWQYFEHSMTFLFL